MDHPMVTYWRDKNVNDLTREEAIDALKQCILLLRQAQDRAAAVHRMHQFFAEVRSRP